MTSDWADHLSTLFPEVRLKRFLEMRGADGGPWDSICGLPALWVGLLYDTSALDAAWDLCKGWSAEDHAYLRAEVPRRGLDTPFGQGTVRDVAREMLALSDSGLKARGVTDSMGQDESHFLRELKKRADGGPTPAEGLLQAYENEWGGNIDALFEDIAY